MREESDLPVPRRLASWGGPPQWSPPDRFVKASLLRDSAERYLNTIKKRWWIPVLSLLLLGGPALYYGIITPPAYRSQTMLWAGHKLDLPEGKIYSEELSSYLGTQVELIKSPWIQQRALASVRSQFPEAVPNERAIILNATVSPKSSTLQLTATGRSPEATRLFLDTVVEEYSNFKNESRKKTSASALSTISQQITEVEKQMQEKQRVISAFQNANNISFLTESGTSAGSHLAKLNELISELETEHRALELMSPEQLTDVAQTPVGSTSGLNVPGQRAAQSVVAATAGQQAGYYQALQQLQALQAKRDEFTNVLRATHSKMIKFNQEIAALEKFLDTLKAKNQEQASAQIASRKKALELQLDNLKSQYSTWETNATQASRKLVEYDRMKQELERSQALYNRLLSLVQTVDLTKGLDQEALTQVAPASTAKPTLSKYKIPVAGVFFGLLIGLGTLLILSSADDRFTSVTELTLHLPEEVVAQVPEGGVRQLNQTNGHRSLKQLGQQQAFEEAFRSLRSYLLCMSDLPPGQRIIMITSAVPKEGKTTISANLGAALALAGERVLLIDADLRRSSLHNVFNVKLAPGLREVLAGEATHVEAIVPSGQENLSILPAGEGEASGSELFLLRPMDQLLQKLTSKFDYIIIDSAPVLATDDAGSLGSKTHGVFMVVRAAYTPARMVREGLDRLHKRHVKVLGVVYNRVSQSKDYYSRYSREYYANKEIPRLPGAITHETVGRPPHERA